MVEILRDLSLLEEGENLDAIAHAFIDTVPADRIEKTKKALGFLFPAYKAGKIFNADFTQWKAVVDRSYEEAFDVVAGTDYKTYWEPDGKTVSTRGQIKNALGYASGIRSSIAAQKKANKLKIVDPHLDAVKKFLASAVAVAQIFEKLKTMVVKGRKPPTPEQVAKKQAILAKKTVKTCACCFRPIAVLPNGKIADHGYSLPYQYGKTSSCPGRMFRPLEVSDEGLRYMIDLAKHRITNLEDAVKAAPHIKTLYKKSYSKKGLGDPVGPDAPEWPVLMKQHLAQLNQELDYTQSQLKNFEMRLKNWKPEEPEPATESLRDLTAQLRVLA